MSQPNVRSSWRTRRLKQNNHVPDIINERLLGSLKAYVVGSGPVIEHGSMIGALAEASGAPAYARDLRIGTLYNALDQSLVVLHGFSIRAVLEGQTSPEDLFDFLEFLDHQLLGFQADTEIVVNLVSHYRDFVDGLLQRENQPYRFVDGRVREGLDELQLGIVDGLAAMTDDPQLRSDLTGAIDHFLNPRRRDGKPVFSSWRVPSTPPRSSSGRILRARSPRSEGRHLRLPRWPVRMAPSPRPGIATSMA
jgi:hypothetical protein